MKKFVGTLMAALMIGVMLTACGGSGGAEPNAAANANTDAEQSQGGTVAEEVTYQSILDDYSKKMKDAIPGLVEEYNKEAEGSDGAMETLAKISNSKVEELAKICNEGITEMAELMTKNSDEYDTYEDWAGKLQDAYTEYAGEITDAYMAAA